MEGIIIAIVGVLGIFLIQKIISFSLKVIAIFVGLFIMIYVMPYSIFDNTPKEIKEYEYIIESATNNKNKEKNRKTEKVKNKATKENKEKIEEKILNNKITLISIEKTGFWGICLKCKLNNLSINNAEFIKFANNNNIEIEKENIDNYRKEYKEIVTQFDREEVPIILIISKIHPYGRILDESITPHYLMRELEREIIAQENQSSKIKKTEKEEDEKKEKKEKKEDEEDEEDEDDED